MTINLDTTVSLFEGHLLSPLDYHGNDPIWTGTLNAFWQANQTEFPTWGDLQSVIEPLQLEGAAHAGGGAAAEYTIATQAKLDRARAHVAARLPKQPDQHDLAALRSYAYEHGPKWKAELAADWYHARTRSCDDMPNRGGILHALRNDFGPSWLDDFKFAEPIVWPSLSKITRSELSRLILLTHGDGDLLLKHALRRERSRRASR